MIANKWNRKYKENPTLPSVNKYVQQFYHLAKGKRALDIACGRGQNAIFLAQKGFEVDAVDISSEALKNLQQFPNIQTYNMDINEFIFKEYDLVVVTNFLERSIFTKMQRALKENAIVIYETFTYKSSMNPKYCLRPNELVQSFCDLEIIFYQLIHNETKAILVARKLPIT